jgi:hypothetical protein
MCDVTNVMRHNSSNNTLLLLPWVVQYYHGSCITVFEATVVSYTPAAAHQLFGFQAPLQQQQLLLLLIVARARLALQYQQQLQQKHPRLSD